MAWLALSTALLCGAGMQAADNGSQPSTSQASARAAAEARLQETEARFRRSIELAPDVSSFHADLAETLQRRGKTDEARAEYLEAVRLDSRSPRSRALFGQFLFQQGDVDGAIEQLEAAEKYDPLSPDIAASLGAAYERAGRWKHAARAYERAVQLVPADSQYRRSLREAREHAGIDVDAPLKRAEVSGRPPLAAQVIAWLFNAILGIAALALLYPTVGGALLAMRASLPLRSEAA